MTKTTACVSLFLACAMHPAGAPAQEPIATLHASAHLVEVPATIVDSHGKYVDGLNREEFNVLENGQPQKVLYFASSGDTLSCALLLDTTGSMQAALPRLKNSVARFIDQLGPEDSVAIYTFSEQVVTRQELTKDKAAAKRAVLGLRAGGKTAFYDALAEVTQEIARQSGKKAVVVFTDGDDNASVLPAQAAVGRAARYGVPLFTMAEGEALESARLKKILSDLSKSTGGQSYEVKDMKEIEDIFGQISNVLRHTYLLTYQPPYEPADGKFRRIEVTVGDGRKYRIRAKEGYFPN